ncbi:MAG: thioredoxin domain-containing protein [Beijerinckiaceae bacterium]|nr:thioredoxin domain-containing protein [Beijerinckiaceae bacterium]
MTLKTASGRERPRPEPTNGARLSRRALLLSGASVATLAGAAQAEQWVEVDDDTGAPIQNLRVPAELDPFRLPGVLWVGPTAPDLTLFEFADYNCPVCKQSSIHLDALVRSVEGLRLGLVQNPILSAPSREAARVAVLTLRLAGPAQAYALHRRLFAMRGVVDGARATNAAREQGVDTTMASPDMIKQADAALVAQEKLANAIGFSVTPSYVLNGIGMFGHPGPKSLARMVEAVKACDALVCP